MKVIGFSGKAGAGKDTAAQQLRLHLEEQGHTVTQLFFANSLKQVCALLFGWDYDRLVSDYAYKEGNTLDDGSPDPACEMLGMTRRVVMQKVGTECFRMGLHPETWIIVLKLAIQRGDYDMYDYGLLTDCRFINELQFVKDMDGKIIRIVRGGEQSTLTASTDHASETEWETWTDWDAVINNDIDPDLSVEENLTQLKKQVVDAVLPKTPRMSKPMMAALEEQWNQDMSDTYWDGDANELFWDQREY